MAVFSLGQSFVERLYGRLLLLYPPDFRVRFGSEMLQVFVDAISSTGAGTTRRGSDRSQIASGGASLIMPLIIPLYLAKRQPGPLLSHLLPLAAAINRKCLRQRQRGVPAASFPARVLLR